MSSSKIIYSDLAIIEGLRLRSDYMIMFIYKEYFPIIKFLVTENNGTSEDAEDIFQEALLVIFSKVTDEGFDLSCSFLTYLYSVSKNILLRKLKHKRMVDKNIDDLLVETLISEDEIQNVELNQIIFEVLSQISDQEKKLLLLHYDKVPDADIAKLLNIENPNAIKKLRIKAKNKISQALIEDKRVLEYLQKKK